MVGVRAFELGGRSTRGAALMALCVLMTVRGAPPAHADPQRPTVSFSIPSQSLSSALIAFGEQSNIQVLYKADVARGASAHGVSGKLSPTAALSQLLAGSGLSYHFTNADTVTIERAQSALVSDPRMPEGTILLDPIDVQGAQSPYGPGVGYVATNSVSGTKSDTPIVKTPQTLSVVTRQQMDDQNVQSVPEALRYTSGIVPEQRGTNTDSLEYLYARGFQIDEYLNGLILPGSLQGYNITSIDPYLLDRVELLQGPASVLYGQASPGGILDMQSKRPTDVPLHEIMLQTGSYGRIQGAVDVSEKLNADGTLLGRFTGDAFDTHTQTNFVKEQRYAIAPTISWRPDTNTDLTIFAMLQHDPQAGIYNSVPAAGTVLPGTPIARSFNPGDPGFDQFHKDMQSIGYSLMHKFDDTWTFYQNFRYLHNNETVQYVADDLGFSANGQQLQRETYRNQGNDSTITLDNRLQAKASTGPLQHTATAGVDWYQTDYFHVFEGGSAPNLSIANPQYFQTIPPLDFTFGSSGDQKLNQVGVYGQDQIQWGHWQLLTGVREDLADEQTTAYTTSDISHQSNAAFTWRAGLLYLFDNGVAPYVSYATSFQPEVGSTMSGTPFVPTTGQQYEAGIKYQPPGTNTIVTASAFDINQRNVLTADPTNANFQVQTGEVRSRGATLEAHTQLTDDLRMIGSYTFTDLHNTESNTSDLGKVPVGIPQNLLSAWLTYDLPLPTLRGLQLGGGVRYLGSSWGDATNTFKVSAATLFDAAIHYDLSRVSPQLKGVTLSVTASNVFDKTYISYCSGTSFCTYGAARLILANLKYRW